uniref:Dienelactone hydrolase domain-containing protein n=1 Tax=Rhodosorus marinus TaxID=101924 RepID=A0A7S0G3D5_9RHOD|mmetsp:Transcript_25253/g.36356  ORF Transcript_25253/g.36356 Transcript_25253/m.36356 type:complete len:273 (+) Transcript_25253:51-869(+)
MPGKASRAVAEECCPPGSWPALMSDESGFRGVIVKMANGADAYVVAPSDGSTTGKGLVICQDIYHYLGGRCRGIADQMADAGYFVVMPSLAGGDTIENHTMPDKLGWWCKTYGFQSAFRSHLLEGVIPLMREKGVEKAGMMGFCWGAYLVFEASGDSELTSIFKAAISCHPSYQLHPLVFNGHSEALDLAEKVLIPQLLCSAGNDKDYVREGGSIITVLKAKPEIANNCKVVNFDDMLHGWVNRGDASKPEVEAGVKEAVQLSLNFLKETLS